MTSKNGNIYPHLPIVTSEIAGPPYPHHLNVIDEFITDGSNLSINTTDDVQNIYQAWTNFINVDYSRYLDDENSKAARLAGSAISRKGFASNSAYPDSYNSQVSSWVAALNASYNSQHLF